MEMALSKNENGRINLTKIDRSNLLSNIGHFNNEIDCRIDNLDSIREYLKIQNGIKNLNQRKDKLE